MLNKTSRMILVMDKQRTLLKDKPVAQIGLIWSVLTFFFFFGRFIYYEKSFIDILYSAVSSATFVVIGGLAAKAYLELIYKECQRNRKAKIVLYFAFAALLSGIAIFRLTFDEISDIRIYAKTDLIIFFVAVIVVLFASYGFISLMWQRGKRKKSGPFVPEIE